MGNYFGYMRISTQEERKKQRFNRQETALSRYANTNHIEYVITFREDASGKSFDNRPEWNRLERLLRPGDTVVFADISRFTREAEAGYEKYMQLMEGGINMIFINNQAVSTPYIQELLNVAEQQNLVAKTSLESTVKLLLIVELDRSEQERLAIIERTKAGIAASDKKQGRKKGSLDKMTDSLRQDILRYLADRNITQTQLMEKHHISRNTIKKYIGIVKSQVQEESADNETADTAKIIDNEKGEHNDF